MNRDSLVNQLRIDRETEQRGGGPRIPWRRVTAAAAVIVLVLALAWFLIVRPDVTRVETVEARGGAAGSAQRGAALLDASGYVVAQREATVSSKITGKVLRVLIEEGDHVQAGQVIAQLDDSNARASEIQSQAELQQAEASVQLAQATLADATSKYDRYRSVAGQGLLSDQSIEDARTPYDNARANLAVSRSQVAVSRAGVEVARRNMDDTIVRAPFAGVVTVKAAQPGEMVSPISAGGGFTRTGICTIVDMDSLEVDVDVAESFINKVSQGMSAVVKLDAFPDWEIPAKVIAVIPTADRSKATVTVRLQLLTKDARILPEMGAHVTFLGAAGTGSGGGTSGGVTVPSGAVTTADDGQAVVFVINDNKVERRAVRLGARSGDSQVLIAGVQPGEAVAVKESRPLVDGASVRVGRASQ